MNKDYFVRGGMYERTKAGYIGSYGELLSMARRFYFSGTIMSYTVDGYRGTGFSLRCVVR